MRKRIRAGISELLAITIGIAITVAIGVMLYTFMPNFLSTTVQQQRIGITVISTNVINNSTAVVSLAVKNLGTKAVKEIEVSAIGPNITQVLSPEVSRSTNNNRITLDLNTRPLTPGQELPLVLIVKSKHVHSGTKVDLIVTARFVDESTMSTSISVTVI